MPDHLQLQGIKYWSALKKCLCIPKNADELISASSAAFEVDFSDDKGAQKTQRELEKERDIEREREREHRIWLLSFVLGRFLLLTCLAYLYFVQVLN